MEIKEKKIAIYPGSFDPITNGHIDILKRASYLFDQVIVLVAHNNSKKAHFSPLKRQEMIQDALNELNLKNIAVDVYGGLTIEYAKKVHAKYLIRGLRAVSDFEYEFKLAATNYYIDHEIEMIFLMAHNNFEFISSSSIMEMALGGVDVSELVPSSVNLELQKLKQK